MDGNLSSLKSTVVQKIKENGAQSFEELVVSVSKDIRPRTLLDEWSKRGFVR